MPSSRQKCLRIVGMRIPLGTRRRRAVRRGRHVTFTLAVRRKRNSWAQTKRERDQYAAPGSRRSHPSFGNIRTRCTSARPSCARPPRRDLRRRCSASLEPFSRSSHPCSRSLYLPYGSVSSVFKYKSVFFSFCEDLKRTVLCETDLFILPPTVIEWRDLFQVPCPVILTCAF